MASHSFQLTCQTVFHLSRIIIRTLFGRSVLLRVGAAKARMAMAGTLAESWRGMIAQWRELAPDRFP